MKNTCVGYDSCCPATSTIVTISLRSDSSDDMGTVHCSTPIVRPQSPASGSSTSSRESDRRSVEVSSTTALTTAMMLLLPAQPSPTNSSFMRLHGTDALFTCIVNDRVASHPRATTSGGGDTIAGLSSRMT
jgi:hypothetical protein